MINAGADVNARIEGGWTPLHMAAAFGTAETVKFLLAIGADVNAQSYDGVTPANLAHNNPKLRGTDVLALLAAQVMEKE